MDRPDSIRIQLRKKHIRARECLSPAEREMYSLRAAERIVSLPEFSCLRGFLMTRDAHGLYEPNGFETVNGRAMVRAPGQAG